MESKEIIWGIVVLLGYTIAILQAISIKRLQRKLIEAEFKKIVPIHEDIKVLEEENKIKLHHLQAKKTEINKLERELKQTETLEFTLEEALQILNK